MQVLKDYCQAAQARSQVVWRGESINRTAGLKGVQAGISLVQGRSLSQWSDYNSTSGGGGGGGGSLAMIQIREYEGPQSAFGPDTKKIKYDN